MKRRLFPLMIALVFCLVFISPIQVANADGITQVNLVVWMDSDGDGEISDGDIGLAGMLVEFYWLDTTLVLSGFTDESGTFIATLPGDQEYIIRVTPPEGYHLIPTIQNAAGVWDDLDSDFSQDIPSELVIRLLSGAIYSNIASGWVEYYLGSPSPSPTPTPNQDYTPTPTPSDPVVPPTGDHNGIGPLAVALGLGMLLLAGALCWIRREKRPEARA